MAGHFITAWVLMICVAKIVLQKKYKKRTKGEPKLMKFRRLIL